MATVNNSEQSQEAALENRLYSIDLNEEHDVSGGMTAAEAEAKRRRDFLASFSAKEDKKIRRKVDWRFLWLAGMLYLIKNIDYQNAAAVKVLHVGSPSNILTELGMTPDAYNWVQSIYYISYILFEVPSNLLMKKMTPRSFQTRIIFTWGFVLTLHATCFNKESMYAARFFLGAAEAGMFPGLAAQLCSWYPSDEMGKPIMWMFAIQNFSGVIGSLLAYGISYMDGIAGLSAWRWVYLLEGMFTLLFSLVVHKVLPDYPRSERTGAWLTDREQEYIEARLGADAPKTDDKEFDKKEIMASLKDPRTYAFMFTQVFMNLGGYALTWQLPTITTQLGFAELPRNQLLNIPPAALAVLAIIFAGWFMKKAWITRPAFISCLCAGGLASFIVLTTMTNKMAIYISCTLAFMFYSVFLVPFWSWRSSSLKGSTGTAFTLAFQSCIGQIGGVIGPQLFTDKLKGDDGLYKLPFGVAAGSIALGWIFALWAWWLTRQVERDVLAQRREKNEMGRGLIASYSCIY
ncbi:Major facilitator superfamily domain containing protein [Naviculisporaceae sp. PSN 640]